VPTPSEIAASEERSIKTQASINTRSGIVRTGPIVVADPQTVPRAKARIISRPGRLALQLLGVAAVGAVLLVNMVDPYTGAAASQYFTVAVSNPEDLPTQTLAAGGGVAIAVARDNYGVTAPPPPPPPPPPVAPAEDKPASDANAKPSDDSGDDSGDDNSDSGSSGAYAPPAGPPDPGSAQEYAYGAVAARGWGPEQYDCLVSLWNRESGWRYNAYNPSGAYGIPQALPGSKMASAGEDWETNPNTQIDWGLNYITGTYGTPCDAWGHSESSGWY
jgi:hypothetical protein